MTEVRDILTGENHPLLVLLVREGRKLYFEKECLESVTIHRRINDGPWEVLVMKGFCSPSQKFLKFGG